MRKIRVAMDLSSSGIGGPYMSTMNIMNSSLKERVEFIPFIYDTSIGHGISIKRIMDIKNKIEKINPDLVHFSGLQLSGFHIAMAIKLANIKKSLLTIRGSSLEAINFKWYLRIIMFILEWITIASTTACYGVSRYSSQLLIPRLFKKKNKGHIYNFSTSNYLSNAKVTRQDLGFSDNDVIIASVARITKEKGYAVLTETIIADKNPNTKYLIVGDGDYLSTMRRRISEYGLDDKVVFTGYRNDVGSLLSISDIFVLPTLHETLSVSLLEASRAKLPLIGSKVGGVPEVIDDGLNGFLVPAGESQTILDKIDVLVNDIILRKSMGERAKMKIETTFNDELIANQIFNLYKEILENKNEE